MKIDRDIRGAAAVGQLTEVTAWEAELILNLRLWQDSNRGKQQVWTSYVNAFGTEKGRQELLAFERLLGLIDTHMLRPLVRHGVACRCIGSDEAVFANMVRLASEGDFHEASIIATLLVRPAFAEHVTILSAEVGNSLREVVRGHNVRRDGLTRNAIVLH